MIRIRVRSGYYFCAPTCRALLWNIKRRMENDGLSWLAPLVAVNYLVVIPKRHRRHFVFGIATCASWIHTLVARRSVAKLFLIQPDLKSGNSEQDPTSELWDRSLRIGDQSLKCVFTNNNSRHTSSFTHFMLGTNMTNITIHFSLYLSHVACMTTLDIE